MLGHDGDLEDPAQPVEDGPEVGHLRLTDTPMTPERELLIGAYFTNEYSLEAAALFNPSMVWDPDQSGLKPGQKRFILSLRATGEDWMIEVLVMA